MSPPEPRIVVREALLARANDTLGDCVFTCLERQQIPLEDMAAFIEGDASTTDDVAAGSREEIAALVRRRFPDGSVDDIAALLAKREPGVLPCAFVVKLPDGSIDVSVVAAADERGELRRMARTADAVLRACQRRHTTKPWQTR
jgi:hypothetical protein